MTRTITSSGPRVGADFYYQLTLNNAATPFYLRGDIASRVWSTREDAGTLPFYLWTYSLGAGWRAGNGLSLEAGYRGAAGVWRAQTPEITTIQWDGLYFGVSIK